MENTIENRDIAILIQELVETLTQETLKPTSEVISIIAKHYNKDRKEIIDFLKLIDSPFTKNSNYVYFDEFNNSYVTRTAYLSQYFKVIKKVANSLSKNNILEKKKYSNPIDSLIDIDYNIDNEPIDEVDIIFETLTDFMKEK